ncbi:unnamed protein product, partial [marine sediment metagenome]
SEGFPAVFTVTGHTGDPMCTATESPIPTGYNSTGTCAALLGDGECTIFNTLREAEFLVRKDFSDDNPDAVSVSLVCATGDVSPAGASASEGFPAVFTVTGHTGDPMCTATESPIPTGYNSTGTCAALLGDGECTIFNTLREAEFLVRKDFSDDNPDAVSVSLVCATGDVSPAGASASEGFPAVFTVTGHTGDPMCTATESPIPTGYNSTGTCAALLGDGECTIFNTLREAEFLVRKDFSDDNPDAVSVSLVCATGDVSPAG